MVVNIRSKFQKDFESVVSLLRTPESLLFISKPLILFYPRDGGFPEQWCRGKYEADMKLCGIIPFGKQTINIEEISGFNEDEFILRDNGFGDSASRWDHWMFVKKTNNPSEVIYTDRVEVSAGVITPAIALFAALFYSWRQHRWKVLLRQNC